MGVRAVGVRVLFGSPPSPPIISAEVLRGLRAPDGSRPCRDGLGRALRWIGDREIPIEQALEEAQSVLASSDIEWGRRALGISGSGYDYGYGYGCESGCYGYGSIYDDYGSGSGYSYGSSGSGHGYADGSGDGYGYGYGSGFGSGFGYGSGDGYGYGDDYGSGSGEEIG